MKVSKSLLQKYGTPRYLGVWFLFAGPQSGILSKENFDQAGFLSSFKDCYLAMLNEKNDVKTIIPSLVQSSIIFNTFPQIHTLPFIYIWASIFAKKALSNKFLLSYANIAKMLIPLAEKEMEMIKQREEDKRHSTIRPN